MANPCGGAKVDPAYRVVDIPGDGLLVTSHPHYERQLWGLVKLRGKQGCPCAMCAHDVGTHAYRPITNKGNRMDRICTRHVAVRRRARPA